MKKASVFTGDTLGTFTDGVVNTVSGLVQEDLNKRDEGLSNIGDAVGRTVEEVREETFYVVAIFTGMRRGEILGLKWDDIDLLQGKIHVSRSLARVKGKGLLLKDVKTKKSKRQISISPYVISKLMVHLERQQSWISLTKSIYKDQGMVFSALNGNFKDPDNQLHEFNRCIKQAEVSKISIHDLRHLHATLMLKNGENPKVVSERLGHSRVGITLDIYTHVTADIQDEVPFAWNIPFFAKVENDIL